MDGIANKFDLNPATLLVLIGLANHFNPDKNIVFPSQEYLSIHLNISERSVVRAIKELIAKNLIIKSKKGSNNIYAFTSIFFDSLKMSPAKCQKDTRTSAKMSPKHDNSKYKNKVVNFQKTNDTSTNYPSAESTKKFINKMKSVKTGSPLDMDYEEAMNFLNKLLPELKNSYFARELRKKWNIPE